MRQRVWGMIASIVVLLVSTLFILPTRLAETGSACDAGSCIYLPHVANMPLVRVVGSRQERVHDGPQVYYFIAGEIQNMGSSALYEVEVSISIFDPAGEFQRKYIVQPILPATFPGAVNPFYLRTDPLPGPVAELSHESQVESWRYDNPKGHQPLTIVSQTIVKGYIWSVVQGLVRNDTPYTLHGIRVLVWIEDDLPDFRLAEVEASSLESGATAGYRLEINHGYASPPDLHGVQAQGTLLP
jgi:hypothetical protein